ncbi:hypothetical protein BVX98_07860, partial [bacterium F11]
ILPRYIFEHYLKSDVPENLPRTAGGNNDYLGAYFTGGPTNQTQYGPDIYGFNWWFNTNKSVWPDAPADTFQANGHWNQEVMTVIPSLNMVVAARGSWGEFKPGDANAEMNKNLKLLVDAVQSNTGFIGTHEKWAKIEIPLEGPNLTATGDPNPFSIFVDVTFKGPSNQTYVVPAFYDGDGNGGEDGSIWKVRFSADEKGSWTFSSTSTEPLLNGQSGSFDITDPSPTAPDFYKWGRLEHPGTADNQIRYLKFRDGPFWLKAGCDDPENFLGKFSNYDTPAERKAAVDYLTNRGINSFYVMTHNLEGDHRDVWPWLGATQAEAKLNGEPDARFNIPKLHEWLDLFEHMQTKGMVLYMILEDDSAWKGYDHDRYYREMVAHFGHLPGLLFNINEEYNENYNLTEALGFAESLRNIDPYRHPIGIHNVNSPNDSYVDAPYIDFTAIQTKGSDPLVHNSKTIDWINRSLSRNKRVLMVGYDEPRPELNRKGWWSAYMGGGVWEIHTTSSYNRWMDAWEPAWTELGGARKFMESLPFWEMVPSNHLVTSGQAYCLAKPGEVYAFYLPNGGTISVDLPPGSTNNVAWWDPTKGLDGTFENQSQIGGGSQSLAAPGPGDWALRIVTGSVGSNNSPWANDGTSEVAPGDSASIQLSYTDPDGPGPYTHTITQNPSKGTLSGSGATRTYTANASASGTDTFKWKVNDGEDDSNEATITITIQIGNVAPVTSNQTKTTTENTVVSIPLSYEDPDGPGPYSFTIVQQPLKGTVAPDGTGGNDYIYTPNSGMSGSDQFTWKVNDGLIDSNIATVSITIIADTPANDPPIINLESFLEITLPAMAELRPDVSDPDSPANNLSFLWTKVFGPDEGYQFLSPIGFVPSPDQLKDINIGFTLPDSYVFRLRVSDEENTVFTEIQIRVYPDSGSIPPNPNPGEKKKYDKV